MNLPLPHNFNSNHELSEMSPKGTWIDVNINKLIAPIRSKIFGTNKGRCTIHSSLAPKNDQKLESM